MSSDMRSVADPLYRALLLLLFDCVVASLTTNMITLSCCHSRTVTVNSSQRQTLPMIVRHLMLMVNFSAVRLLFLLPYRKIQQVYDTSLSCVYTVELWVKCWAPHTDHGKSRQRKTGVIDG